MELEANSTAVLRDSLTNLRHSPTGILVKLARILESYPVIVPFSVGGTAVNPSDHDAISGEAVIGGIPIEICGLDFTFIGGSMGSVVGEKVSRSIQRAGKARVPLIIASQSGGARMMEGTTSLMQMAKTSAQLARFGQQGGLFISLLMDPCTAGVLASFAMLGDIILAEPGALVGFAGPRVIKQTIGEELPPGFQRSEFVLEHGFIDMIVPRKEMRARLTDILQFFAHPQARPGGDAEAGHDLTDAAYSAHQ